MAEPERKTVTLYDFLTEAQIKQALDLYNKRTDDLAFITACVREVIGPNMAEINRKLGQENDTHYLAYCVQYTFDQAVRAQAQREQRVRRAQRGGPLQN
jgi:phage portal protein BeeE